MNKLSRWGIGCLSILGGLVVIAFIIAIINSNPGDTNTAARVVPTFTPTPNKQQQSKAPIQEIKSTPAPTLPPEPTPIPGIGVDVVVGEVRWKMLTVETLGKILKSENQFIDDVTTSGIFIRLRWEMEVLGGDPLNFSGFELVDDQERSFEHSTNVFSFIPEAEECWFLTNLNPGIIKTCNMIYEVPENALSLKAKVGSLKFFSNEQALIDLGM